LAGLSWYGIANSVALVRELGKYLQYELCNLDDTQVNLKTLAALLLLVCTAASAETTPRLIVNANLLSPERTDVLPDAWVRIDSGAIVEVGSGAVDTSGFDVIDAGGGYLIPGLIDSHVHLYHATGLKRKYTSNFDALYEEYMQQQPRSFLYFGFTSVIELNADAESNLRFESAPLHPRLFHCGQGVILSDGFMALELEDASIEEFNPGYLIDHYSGGLVPQDADARKHTPVAVVDYVRDKGGRCIKLYYEEALWWPGGAPEFRLPSVEIVRDIVTAAHAVHMPVVLHATTPAGHRFAADAGVDILAHGMWEWPDQSFDAPEPKPEYRRIAKRIANTGIKMQPSFSTIRNAASLFDPDLLSDPAWRHAVPDIYLDYLRTDAQKQRDAFIAMFGSQLAQNTSLKDRPSQMSAFNSRYERLVGEMDANGAELLFGTDTAVGGFGWASPPGLAACWEMRAWVRAGISLRSLFESMTIANARAFGLDGEIGTIEAGKRADLLVLADNPLVDVSAYDTIKIVILGGNEIQRDSLSAQTAKPR
jgi:imidazolonepropionase-like amidohydrolase